MNLDLSQGGGTSQPLFQPGRVTPQLLVQDRGKGMENREGGIFMGEGEERDKNIGSILVDGEILIGFKNYLSIG